MTNQIETSKTFQEKMHERIKESMGDLLTDEDLTKIVESSIQKAFFEERLDTERSTKYTQYTKPSMAVEIVTELLKDQVSEAVKNYVSENSDEFKKIIADVTKIGMASAFIQYLDNSIMNGKIQIQNDLMDALGVNRNY